MKIKKGDKILACSPAIRDDIDYKIIGGKQEYGRPLTVTKVFSHGVRTKERGYIHRNNILNKIQ
jgi:hypothetical protein